LADRILTLKDVKDKIHVSNADAILFLASDKASFITGQIIRINGGKTAT